VKAAGGCGGKQLVAAFFDLLDGLSLIQQLEHATS